MSQPDTLVWIVNQFVSLGIAVQVDADSLTCQPKAALTPELRAAIRQHKPLLVALLGMRDPPAKALPSMLPLRPADYYDGAQRQERWTDAYDPSKRLCGTCRFHDVDAWARQYHDSDRDVGLCRRRPPTPRLVPYDWPTDKMVDEGILSRSEFPLWGDWPETFETAWCGEWERVELPAYHCWYCRHPLIDHTLAPVTPGEHGPLRCWCHCAVPTPAAGQKGVAA